MLRLMFLSCFALLGCATHSPIGVQTPSAPTLAIPSDARPFLAGVAATFQRDCRSYQGDKETLQLLEKACAMGDVTGCRKGAYRIACGIGAAAEPARAETMAKVGCDHNDVESCNAAGVFALARPNVSADDVARAVKSYEHSCSVDQERASTLALVYDMGLGVPKDAQRGNALLDQACERKNANACYNLGWVNEQRSEFARAVALYKQACDMNLPQGCVNLGVLHERGQGVPLDPAEAARLFEKGCTGGFAIGCADLGHYYDAGSGVAKDPLRAVAFYEKGCTGSWAPACTALGFHAESGAAGCHKTKAVAWRSTRRAARVATTRAAPTSGFSSSTAKAASRRTSRWPSASSSAPATEAPRRAATTSAWPSCPRAGSPRIRRARRSLPRGV